MAHIKKDFSVASQNSTPTTAHKGHFKTLRTAMLAAFAATASIPTQADPASDMAMVLNSQMQQQFMWQNTLNDTAQQDQSRRYYRQENPQPAPTVQEEYVIQNSITPPSGTTLIISEDGKTATVAPDDTAAVFDGRMRQYFIDEQMKNIKREKTQEQAPTIEGTAPSNQPLRIEIYSYAPPSQQMRPYASAPQTFLGMNANQIGFGLIGIFSFATIAIYGNLFHQKKMQEWAEKDERIYNKMKGAAATRKMQAVQKPASARAAIKNNQNLRQRLRKQA